MSPPADRAALQPLRRSLRQRRRALRGSERRQCEHAIHAAVRALLLRRWRRIAAFEAIDGEPDLAPVLGPVLLRGRVLALPEIVHGAREPKMRFVAARADGRQLLVPPAALDLALVPLIGFDATGNRIGFGAGYYDRAFRQLRGRTHWRHPQLVGIAFECQRVEVLPAAPWDIPLDAIVTERGLQRFPLQQRT